MKIRTEGFEEVLRTIEGLSDVDFAEIINHQLEQIYARGQIPGTGTPYDTGNLMRSMYIKKATPETKSGVVGYRAYYAPYVEYGHRSRNGWWVEGQYFLTKNMEQQEDLFMDEALEAYERIIKR